VNYGDIYKQTGGTGDFLPLGQTTRDWAGMTTDSSGNVYATAYYGDIYELSSSGGTPNLSGGELVFSSGAGKGTGASTISFKTGTTLSSGNTLQLLQTKMTILGNGNVGIGTTTPVSGLELYDSTANDRIFTITSDTTTNDPLIKFRTATTSLAVKFSIGVDASDSDTFKIDSNDGLSTSPDFKIDSTGVTTIANARLGAQSFPEDGGILSWLDMSVTSSSTSGTVESYSAQIDSNPILTVYAESDGSGGIQNKRVGIGTTTPAYTLDVLASGTGVIARFNSNNSTGCTLATGGTISCSSDSRLKKNIHSTTLGLETLLALRPVEYNWNYQSDGDMKSFGFIAQEVGALIPELVRMDDNGYLQLNTIGLVPILAKAVQEENTKVTTLGANVSVTSLKTIANATTLASLQSSVDEQLTAVSEAENGFEVRLASLEEKAVDTAALSIKVTDLESAVSLLQSSNRVLLDFYNSLSLGNVLVKNADGNLDLSNGKIRAKELSTGALAIEIVDEEAPTIGSATLFPKAVDKKGAKDVDGNDIADGFDDVTGDSMDDPDVLARNGKQIVVKTKAVSVGSRIFLTPKQAIAEPLAVTDISGGKGFTVEMKNETSEEIPVDWIIVEEK
ncbi:MAG: tail fiber domain-containing protein, partial [Candidatus Moraniibacteriota bacterium]